MSISLKSIAKTFPPLKTKSHKKSRGKVFIIAGSRGMTGAAALATRAAQRTGAGIVTLAFPDELISIYKEILPEVMTVPCFSTNEGTFSKRSLDSLLRKAGSFDITAIGPGLSRNKETSELAREFIRKVNKPLIIDADGLNALEGNLEVISSRKALTVITPHEMEMTRLMRFGATQDPWNDEFRKTTALKKSKEWNVYIVLKGNKTVVASSDDELYINDTGGPHLATAGTGDVLTGVIAALISTDLSHPFDVLSVAVYIHGLSGDLAKQDMGERSVIASDVIKYIPQAIREAGHG